MKTILAAAAFLTATLAAPALAGTQDFTIVNNTGYQIQEIYVASSDKLEWEEDVLGRQVLNDGERFRLGFSRSEDACLWDIKVKYQDGETAQWSQVNLCEVSVVSLAYDAESGRTIAHNE